MNIADARRALAGFDDRVDDALRVGLGLVILLAGLHKLVAPGPWAAYLVPPFDAWVLLTPRQFMLLNGVLEPPFALALLLDRYTVFAAGFVAASLAATILYLAVASALGAPFVDVLIRDIGLLALAVGVTVRAACRRAD
jgi:uncharacterized protein YjeT (DUF2065 family)